MASDARTEILSRIRAAAGGGVNANLAAEGWLKLPRDYRRTSTRTQTELIHQLIDRLIDYDAHVVEVDEPEIAQTVSTLLRSRGLPRLVVPEGVPSHFLPLDLVSGGLDIGIDNGLSIAELNLCGGVLTLATLAIAETGTLVLQNVPGQGRRAASLVPDYHLCLVNAANVVGTVPEAMARLQDTAGLATTFISGPSATADIEMTRIKGVHGPRFLDVVLYR